MFTIRAGRLGPRSLSAIALVLAAACLGGCNPRHGRNAVASFAAARSPIAQGGSTTLTAVFSGGSGSIDQGVGAVRSGQAVTVSPAADTTYTLTIRGGRGPDATATATVRVVPPAAIASFEAGTPAVAAGASTTLTAVFSGGSGTVDQGVGPVTSGQPVTVSPSADTTYTLTVLGEGGDQATATAAVAILRPAAIASFAAAKSPLTQGRSTTLTPVFTGESATVDHGVGPVQSGQPVMVSPAGTTTFTLTVHGAVGPDATATAEVVMVPAPAITGFAAARSPVTTGHSTTLTAAFSGGTGTVDHGVGAVTSGVAAGTGALTQDTSFLLTVTNPAGDSVYRTAAVAVVPAAAITSFVASPGTVASGGSSTLTAVFSGGTGTVDHGVGPVLSGAHAGTGPISQATVFTLTVTNPAGDAVTSTAAVAIQGVAYSISGTVSGAATSGVTMSLGGDATASTTTSATGTYSFAGLNPGSYTVTPSRAKHSFTPASAQVAVVAEDHPGVDFVGRLTALEEFTVGSHPMQIAAAPDGTVWFTEDYVNKIGRLTTAGQLTEYPVPTADSGLAGIAVWVPNILTIPTGDFSVGYAVIFTERNASKIGVLHPGDGSVTEYATPRRSACPAYIATGPEPGDLAWFTMACEPQSTMSSIASLDLTDGTMVEHTLHTGGDALAGLAVAPDGSVWFAEPNQGRIGRYKAGEVTSECQLPARLETPQAVAIVPRAGGWTVYFTEPAGYQIGAVTTMPYACIPSPFTSWNIPTSMSIPGMITAGPGCSGGGGAAAWYADGRGKVSCLAADGTFREISVSPASPTGIAYGADGNIWFTEPYQLKVGRLPVD